MKSASEIGQEESYRSDLGLKGDLKCIKCMVLSACSFGGIVDINPLFVFKLLR